MRPVIAISIGDVNGIGPEVILKSCIRSEIFEVCRPVVFGSIEALRWYQKKISADVTIEVIDSTTNAKEKRISVVNTGGRFDEMDIGKPTSTSGRISIDAITKAQKAVHDGNAEALVTAPISKEAIALAGSPFIGHTDMLAALCICSEDIIMILHSTAMRVGLVTIHSPVSQIAESITKENVLKTIWAGNRTLIRDFAISNPRMAVLALNPHGGDGGRLGTEEIESIIPAIIEAQKEGIRVEGPFPADGFFSAYNKELYDLIIAMYHDQGLIPFKMQANGLGVNVTGGLPIVRTSPDHGTAFSIAALGIANAESMKEAILLASAIAASRKRGV